MYVSYTYRTFFHWLIYFVLYLSRIFFVKCWNFTKFCFHLNCRRNAVTKLIRHRLRKNSYLETPRADSQKREKKLNVFSHFSRRSTASRYCCWSVLTSCRASRCVSGPRSRYTSTWCVYRRSGCRAHPWRHDLQQLTSPRHPDPNFISMKANCVVCCSLRVYLISFNYCTSY